MTGVFADTSFYVALSNTRDTHHARAVELTREFRRLMVTTDFVLVELGNWLSRSGDRAVFVSLMAQLRADPHSVILPATRELFDRGFELFAGRMDKDWSLVDCISFQVMSEEKIAEALSADHHFEQAGYTILLK